MMTKKEQIPDASPSVFVELSILIREFPDSSAKQIYLPESLVTASLMMVPLVPMFTHHTYPLKAFGEFFPTGHDNISGCERVPFNRKVVAELVVEGTKKLTCYSQLQSTKPPDDDIRAPHRTMELSRSSGNTPIYWIFVREVRVLYLILQSVTKTILRVLHHATPLRRTTLPSTRSSCVKSEHCTLYSSLSRRLYSGYHITRGLYRSRMSQTFVYEV